MTKFLIYFGLFLGSTLGSFVPALWGADMLSAAGFLWSTLGGIIGVWIGYRIAQRIE